MLTKLLIYRRSLKEEQISITKDNAYKIRFALEYELKILRQKLNKSVDKKKIEAMKMSRKTLLNALVLANHIAKNLNTI